jgi:excisionase family DNA binding protein
VRRLVGIREAAETLGVSTQTLYRLIGRGELSVVKIGDRTLFRLDDLEAFIEQSTRRRGCESA